MFIYRAVSSSVFKKIFFEKPLTNQSKYDIIKIQKNKRGNQKMNERTNYIDRVIAKWGFESPATILMATLVEDEDNYTNEYLEELCEVLCR